MKNILLAVTGLNPQVITEALYALFLEGRQVDVVRVITTKQGKEVINAHLLPPREGHFHKLFHEYAITSSKPDFSSTNIYTIKSENGLELDDIRQEEDNEQLLSLCMEQAFELTQDSETAVYFLVAGGRKTMTSCLTLAAQLYGRPQDRIYHVLVSPEFEGLTDFWYPPRKSVPVTFLDKNHEPVSKETRFARIRLIPVPFVSVRDQLNPELFDGPRQPADLLQALVREDPKYLVIKLAEGKISYGSREMDMHPAWLALYAFFAQSKKDCSRSQDCRTCRDCFLEATKLTGEEKLEEIQRLYRVIPGSRQIEEMSDSGISTLSVANFYSYRSKINRKLQRTYGQNHIQELEIAASGNKPDTCYGLRIDRSRIVVE